MNDRFQNLLKSAGFGTGPREAAGSPPSFTFLSFTFQLVCRLSFKGWNRFIHLINSKQHIFQEPLCVGHHLKCWGHRTLDKSLLSWSSELKCTKVFMVKMIWDLGTALKYWEGVWGGIDEARLAIAGSCWSCRTGPRGCVTWSSLPVSTFESKSFWKGVRRKEAHSLISGTLSKYWAGQKIRSVFPLQRL